MTENINTTTPSGKLTFHVFAALAEFERDILRQRVNAGLKAARRRGRVGGRPKALSEADLKKARALLSSGEYTKLVAEDPCGQPSYTLAGSALAQELDMSIAITYLEAHEPKPRNTVSIINRQGNVVLNYSKVFICDFGADDLLKSNPNVAEIGCDVNCSPGNSFDVCTLNCAEGQVRVGAMICADREFPKPANELMLNGAEVIIVPNACTWDEIRTAGLKTRAFENLVGVAMANYPNNGNSQAYTCVAWKEGQGGKDTLIAKAGEQEEILVVQFDLDEIRAFRKAESWRLDHQRFHASIR